MIKLVGTNHLMSKEEIEEIINHENPDVIGVELCKTRLKVMVTPKAQEQAPQVEDKSILGKISSVIKRKAEESNLVYGSDMINAAKYALDKDIPLALLDKDILEIKSLFEKLPQAEVIGFTKELAAFENQSLKKEVDAEMTLNELRTNFPIAFEFLITMRELTIQNNILKTIIKYPGQKILVFLGKGHVKAIEKELESTIKKEVELSK